jgi:hypothetical protein
MEKERKMDFLVDKSDDALIKELQRVSDLLKKQNITANEFKQYGNIGVTTIRRRFGSWNRALTKAGLEAIHRINIPNEEIFQDIDQVWSKLEHKPSYKEFNKLSRFSSNTLEKRFGSYLKALKAYIDWKNQNSDNSSTIKQDSEISKHTNNIYSDSKDRSKRKRYGNLLNFRGLQHAPLNELGVVFLFGMVSKELGFIVEAISVDFPDCEAKRYDSQSKTWEKIAIEFEFKSSNFIKHGHDSGQCDLIVCWEHDWNDCPLEVLELSKIIKDLKE